MCPTQPSLTQLPMLSLLFSNIKSMDEDMRMVDGALSADKVEAWQKFVRRSARFRTAVEDRFGRAFDQDELYDSDDDGPVIVEIDAY